MRTSRVLIIIGIALAVVLVGLYVAVLVTRLPRTPVLSGSAIGLVEVKGIIGTDPDLAANSSDLVAQIKSYTRNRSIPVILLRIDSPGGGAAASQEIYAQLLKAKAAGKKVVASLGSVAASGGYYVACPADRIVANPATVTGSIGVIFEFPMLEPLMKKVGVSVEVVKSAEHKDIGSPFRPMSDTEKELMNGVVTDVFDQFVTAVSEGRRLPREKVLAIADGRILSGRQARELGLVDTLGGYEDAVRIAADLAGIRGDPTVVRVRRPLPFFRSLFTSAATRLLMPRLQYRAF